MANKFIPYTKTTIDSVISSGKSLGLSENAIAFKTIIDDEIAIPYYNIITKYKDAINKYIETVTLDEEEFFQYKCKPNYYCFKTYGTPELASSLLYINNMDSSTKFKNTTFKRFNKDILKVINELVTLTIKDIKKNRMENGV